MLGPSIDLFCYSGTGNTLLVAQEMAQVFSSAGRVVTLSKLEHTDPARIDTSKTIGLAFPVAFQSTLPFVWQFLKALPQAEGTPIFMVDTMMAFSGAIVGLLKKVLTAKGYRCTGSCEIKMPNNALPKSINERRNRAIIDAGLEKAREYAHELVDGQATWKGIPFLSQAFYNLCCNDFMMKHVNLAMGKKITVDTEKCVRCNLCIELCPVHNIEMKTYPQWHDTCELCMRCLCFCPTQAVYIPGKEFQQYRAVKANDLLYRTKKG